MNVAGAVCPTNEYVRGVREVGPVCVHPPVVTCEGVKVWPLHCTWCAAGSGGTWHTFTQADQDAEAVTHHIGPSEQGRRRDGEQRLARRCTRRLALRGLGAAT